MILLSAQTYLSFFVVVSLIAVFISSVRSYRATRRKLIQIKQKLESDISVAQMMQSEQRISEFLKTNRLQPGVSIQIIADKPNIVEGGVQEDLTDRAWLSGPNENGKMTVAFKKGLSEEDYHFDFAHECGHLINGDPTPATRPEGYNKPQAEQLADYTGAALLMPFNKVCDFLDEHDYEKSSRRQKQILIRELCDKYKVTEIIALRRIKEVYTIKQAM